MKLAFLSLCLLATGAAHSHGSDSTAAPFASVVRHADVIVATLPVIGIKFFVGKPPQQRLTSYGESFVLHDRASLLLFERHSSYQVTAHLSPSPAGLGIESTFNAQSFGGTTTQNRYFIKAQ